MNSSVSSELFSPSINPKCGTPIPVLITDRQAGTSVPKRKPCYNKTIKRNNKLLTAVQLPVVVNLNPRSIYNKRDEFRTMMEQLSVGVCFISESWDRESLGIEDAIAIEGYRVIKNVLQRKRKGGKPALVISESNYLIKELCPDVITVPPNIEAVWALLTPKSGGSKSNIRHIAVCSYYYTEKTKRSDFIDHISEAYNLLSSKYSPGLQFILAGDTNRLNMNSILSLSPNLKQEVKVVTRTNPDAILDTITSTLSAYYQEPYTLPPLDNDCDKNGKPSDHLIVVMEPISADVPTKRVNKYVTVRPLPQSGLDQLSDWLKSQKWETIFGATTANEKAENLQNLMLEKINKFLPEKKLKICSEDQPWFSDKLRKIDRKQKREYSKHKKSNKWKRLNDIYLEKSEDEKERYYKNIVEDLKVSNPGQWYSKLKRMTSHNQAKSEEPIVESLMDLPNQTQAEEIANQFGKISNLYEPLKTEDICLDDIKNTKPYPCMEPYFVHQKIKSMKSNSATVYGDIPIKIIKLFGYELSFPLSDIYKRSCKYGEYPKIWKVEMITPAPKCYPPKDPTQLRKISGTLNFSKIYEKFLAEVMVMDMGPTSDPSQYGNEKGISTQHYLVNMINRILTCLDTNNSKEAYAVIAHLVDWNQAFDRQCPTLGIQSFIKNGVRKSIIPVLINYFQDREMIVKWRGVFSSVRQLPGGGPQGCHLGGLEYGSQSNDSGQCVADEDRYKFVDDMSILEVINLITCGLASYNFTNHVASDIGIGDSYLPSTNILSQDYLNSVQKWTVDRKMKLNKEKTKVMIFNFTFNFQFSTRVYLEDTLLDLVNETKLLGCQLSSDMTWWRNTNNLTKKGYQRLEIIRKLYSFKVPLKDLSHIYTLYVRSILEFNCCVWHFSITQAEDNDIERVQKIACKIILKDGYTNYENALEALALKNLSERRRDLCLKFAQRCLKFDKTKDMFPLKSQSKYALRNSEKYVVNFASTSRLYNSSIPMMQRLLNEDE